ncbi:MAG TPA: DUF998 domain-containing protein [Ktedonobacteraceae bacterium]|nr:DUF998 domain-containing protein [Ktedonobacteraceae bacterium]
MLTANNQVQQTQHDSLVTKLLIACGAIGPILFTLVFLVEGATRPGYSQWRDFVSELGASNQGWIQDINFIFCGLCMICFAIGLRLVLRAGRGSVAGPLFLGLFGLSLIIAGIFPSDPSLGYYPDGFTTVHTLHGIIHAANAIPAFGTLTIAILVLALRFVSDPVWRGWSLYSLLSAIFLIGFFIACVYVSGLDQNGVLPNSPTGFFERIAIIVGWTWLALVAMKQFRLVRSPASSRHVTEKELDPPSHPVTAINGAITE